MMESNPNFKVDHVILTTPIWGSLSNSPTCYGLCTKFEDSSFALCKDVKKAPKRKYRGDWGWLESLNH